MSVEGEDIAASSEEAGSAMSGHVITWVFSVVSACIVGWAWLFTHPAPSFAVVDVNALVKAETESLMQSVKPDTPNEQKEVLVRRASEFGRKLDNAIMQVASECGCVVVNSAAIVAQPARMPIPNITRQVQEYLSRHQ